MSLQSDIKEMLSEVEKYFNNRLGPCSVENCNHFGCKCRKCSYYCKNCEYDNITPCTIEAGL